MSVVEWWKFFRKRGKKEGTDGRVVRAVVSVTMQLLSRSGGHEFEPWIYQSWNAYCVVLLS